MSTEQSSTPVYLTLALPATSSDFNNLESLISSINVKEERYDDLKQFGYKIGIWISAYKEYLNINRGHISSAEVLYNKEQENCNKNVKIELYQLKMTNLKTNIKEQKGQLELYEKILKRKNITPQEIKETNESIKEINAKIKHYEIGWEEMHQTLQLCSDYNNDSDIITITQDMMSTQLENLGKMQEQAKTLKDELANIQSAITRLEAMENKVNLMITQRL